MYDYGTKGVLGFYEAQLQPVVTYRDLQTDVFQWSTTRESSGGCGWAGGGGRSGLVQYMPGVLDDMTLEDDS